MGRALNSFANVSPCFFAALVENRLFDATHVVLQNSEKKFRQCQNFTNICKSKEFNFDSQDRYVVTIYNLYYATI